MTISMPGSIAEPAAASAARVPCTIVTGFLGAGKTTLIRHVLANAQGRRLAIIVNEFGDVGIDGEILKGCGDAACPEQNIVELANGCLCCTVADAFVPALDVILGLRPAVEHIVIETSGLALPKPLVQAFHWPSIKSRVTVDGVVAVVDGAALADGRVAADLDALARQRVADTALDHDDPIEEVFGDQIACADMVVLNKCDLIRDGGLAKAVAAITAALPRAVKIVTVADGKVDPAALLGLGVATENDIENRRTHHDSEETHDHDDFASFVVALPEIADPAALAARVSAAAERDGVLRIKGFAAVPGKPMRLLVQAVGPRVAHHYDRPWAAAEKRAGQLVVIGLKGIDRAAITRTLTG
jgi:cobalamin biosynthesis protein CobW